MDDVMSILERFLFGKDQQSAECTPVDPSAVSDESIVIPVHSSE